MAYTTQNQPLPYVQPYLQDYLGRAQELSNVGYQQSPTQIAQPNQALQTGWQAIQNRAMQGSPTMGAANTQLQNTINGGFLGGSPYLDQSISNAQGDLTRSWNTVQKPAWDKAMQNSGSFGNSGVMEYQQNAANDLQKNLGRISTDMRSNAYNTERGFQQQAIGMAPQFAQQDYMDAGQLLNAGVMQQGYQDRNQQQNYDWWQEAQNFSQNKLNNYGQALGVGTSSGSQQTQPGVSTGSSVLRGTRTV